MHPNNKKLLYIDLTINTYLSMRAIFNDYKIMALVIFSGICYILNSRTYNNIYTNRTLCNIRHVILVQFVGIYGYYLLSCHKPCIEFYFDCSDYKENNIISNIII